MGIGSSGMGDDVGVLFFLAAAISRRLLAQGERFRCFLTRKQGADFLGGAQHAALWQMARLPGAQLLAKHMDVIAGLGSKAVFDGPYLFQKGVRDHGSSSTVGECPALQQRTVFPRCRRMGAASS